MLPQEKRLTAWSVGLVGVVLVFTGATILFQHADFTGRTLAPAADLMQFDDGAGAGDEALVATSEPKPESSNDAIVSGVGVSMLMVGWTVVLLAFLVRGTGPDLESTRYRARRPLRR